MAPFHRGNSWGSVCWNSLAWRCKAMLPLPDTGSHPPYWENQLVLYGHRGFAKTSVKGFSCGPHPFNWGWHSCTVDGNVNWHSYYARRNGGSLKKLGIKLPYDPAIPLLDTDPEETKIERDTCISLLFAAPFTIARTWKQPRSPLTDE